MVWQQLHPVMGAGAPTENPADASVVGTACVIFPYEHDTFNLLLHSYFAQCVLVFFAMVMLL